MAKATFTPGGIVISEADVAHLKALQVPFPGHVRYVSKEEAEAMAANRQPVESPEQRARRLIANAQNTADAVRRFAEAISSACKPKPMINQTNDDKTARDLFNAQNELAQEKSWADTLDTFIRDTLDRVTVMDNRNNRLADDLETKKKEVAYLEKQIEAKNKLINEQQADHLRVSRLLQAEEAKSKDLEATVEKLKKRLTAKRKAGR